MEKRVFRFSDGRIGKRGKELREGRFWEKRTKTDEDRVVWIAVSMSVFLLTIQAKSFVDFVGFCMIDGFSRLNNGKSIPILKICQVIFKFFLFLFLTQKYLQKNIIFHILCRKNNGKP